jgi:hypothetical protein
VAVVGRHANASSLKLSTGLRIGLQKVSVVVLNDMANTHISECAHSDTQPHLE